MLSLLAHVSPKWGPLSTLEAFQFTINKHLARCFNIAVPLPIARVNSYLPLLAADASEEEIRNEFVKACTHDDYDIYTNNLVVPAINEAEWWKFCAYVLCSDGNVITYRCLHHNHEEKYVYEGTIPLCECPLKAVALLEAQAATL